MDIWLVMYILQIELGIYIAHGQFLQGYLQSMAISGCSFPGSFLLGSRGWCQRLPSTGA